MKEKEYFGHIIAIVGLQFGSEGKGAIAEYLAPIASASGRIGAPNAGHTVFYNGKAYVMRQIPCAWINPYAKLILGVSATISLEILLDEIEKIDKILPIKNRLYIDHRAVVISQKQIVKESKTSLAERISSTSAKAGLGIGIAMADKALRNEDCIHASEVPELAGYMCDTVDLINDLVEHDQIVILEGTQGYGLSIDFGPFPYVTSRDTTAPSLFAGFGLNPTPFQSEVIGVLRTFPIRVGGPSGPFPPDSKEVTWDYVKRFSGSKIDLTERTSVTNSIRRVATFSWQQFDEACRINRPKELALTFADYLDAKAYSKDDPIAFRKIENFVSMLEERSGVPVNLIKSGPQTIADYQDYRSSILRRIA